MRQPAVRAAFDGVQEDGQGLAAAIGTGLASQETIAIPKDRQRAARAAAEEAANLLLGAFDVAGSNSVRKRAGGQRIDRGRLDAAAADTQQPARLKEFGPLPMGRRV